MMQDWKHVSELNILSILYPDHPKCFHYKCQQQATLCNMMVNIKNPEWTFMIPMCKKHVNKKPFIMDICKLQEYNGENIGMFANNISIQQVHI